MGFIYRQVVMTLFRVQVLPHKYPMFAVYVGMATTSAPMHAPGLVAAADVGPEKGYRAGLPKPPQHQKRAITMQLDSNDKTRFLYGRRFEPDLPIILHAQPK